MQKHETQRVAGRASCKWLKTKAQICSHPLCKKALPTEYSLPGLSKICQVHVTQCSERAKFPKKNYQCLICWKSREGGLKSVGQVVKRPLSAPAILCNIASEQWWCQWPWFLLRRLPRRGTAIASADAMSWPAYAMKTLAKATALRAEKTTWS